MPNLASSIAAAGDEGSDHALVIADLRRQNEALRAELDELEPTVSAAVLTTTAFRLRDRQALTGALRLLARAVGRLEARRGAE